MTDSRSVRFPETSYGIVKRWHTIEAWTETVARRLRKSSLTVLDYGCGTGDHVTYPLACLGHHVLGVDVHEESIRQASIRYQSPTLSFRLADIDALVNEGARFDLVVCSEVLEHLYHPGKFLDMLTRVLEPGGGVIITTPNGYGSFEWLSSLHGLLARAGIHGLLRRVAHACSRSREAATTPGTEAETVVPTTGFLNMDSTHVQFFRIGDLERIFSDGGFRIIERRARTLLCGPYVDVLFRLAPCEPALCRANNRLADVLPFSWAADWMFLLEHRGAGAQ